jgi:hypothetical protein
MKFFDELLCLLAAILFICATIHLYLTDAQTDLTILVGFGAMFFIAIFCAIVGKHLGD